MSYYDYVREKVFQPAGMASTDSLPESEKVARRAVGYTRALNGAMGGEHRVSPLEGHVGGRRLLDGRRPPALRAGAGVGEADLEGDARRGDPGTRAAVRVRLRRAGGGLAAELRSRRWSTRDERRAPGLPAARLRGRRPQQPRPTRGVRTRGVLRASDAGSVALRKAFVRTGGVDDAACRSSMGAPESCRESAYPSFGVPPAGESVSVARRAPHTAKRPRRVES